MKAVTTWILVANGAQARIFCHDGSARPLRIITEISDADAVSRTDKTDTDRPGRSFDSAGAGRHAMEPSSDAQALAKSAFAKQLCDHLASDFSKGKFERLVIVAAPAMLGNIRAALPKNVTAYGELAKDLTHIPPADIASHLSDILAV